MDSVAWGLTSMWRRLQDSKNRWVYWFKDTTVKLILLLLLVTLQLWISIFLYGSFYYAYMPAVAHLKPVFLQFSSTCDKFSGMEPCPFPHSNITLVKYPQSRLLMTGQQYKVTLELEMPQSPVNEELGVFMVKLNFLSYNGQTATQSIRPAMIRYRSPILKMLEVFTYLPLLLTGYSEEKQTLKVTLLEDFTDNYYKPVLGSYIELQARKIEVYSSVLKIQAHFTGPRYFMYHWPFLSSAVGIGSFFLLLSIFTMLSWQQCAARLWKVSDLEDAPIKFTQTKPISHEERLCINKRNMEQERSALFQGRPQYVTVSSSEIDPANSLRSRHSEPSLLEVSRPSVPSPATSETTGYVESLSQISDDKTMASNLDDTKAENTTAKKTIPDQGDLASESSDETQGFEKLEREEEQDRDKNEEKVKKDERRSGERSKQELESLSVCETPDTELRCRQVHGREEIQ